MKTHKLYEDELKKAIQHALVGVIVFLDIGYIEADDNLKETILEFRFYLYVYLEYQTKTPTYINKCYCILKGNILRYREPK